MRKLLPIISLTLLFLALAACSPAVENTPGPGVPPVTILPATATTAPTPILPPTLSGDVEIQHLLLTSHTRWLSAVAHGRITNYPAPGVTAGPDVSVVQMWIEQPAKARVISGPLQQAPVHEMVSDGVQSRWNANPAQPLPPDINRPFIPPAGLSDTVTPHPLAGMLGTPLSDLLFPAGIAQRGGEYRITGRDSLAGRDVWVVEWGREPGVIIDRLWVDTTTGIILRWQTYGKSGQEIPQTELLIDYIAIDGLIPAETFDLSRTGASLTTPVP